jgi:hypothetical protein
LVESREDILVLEEKFHDGQEVHFLEFQEAHGAVLFEVVEGWPCLSAHEFFLDLLYASDEVFFVVVFLCVLF